jgi:hypothetical protein
MFVELFLLVLLVALVVLVIRGGKSATLVKPLIIQSPGRYHITLAPQLERAQTLIEQITVLFTQSHPPQQDLPGQFFEVRDPDAPAQQGNCYLLAVSYRDKLLYFQAIMPQPLLSDSDSHLKQAREFSEAVLTLHPLLHPAGSDATAKLRGAVETAAQQLRISVKLLNDAE